MMGASHHHMLLDPLSIPTNSDFRKRQIVQINVSRYFKFYTHGWDFVFWVSLVIGNFKEKYKGKKIEWKKKKWMKVKIKLKINKLFLFLTSNSFYLF